LIYEKLIDAIRAIAVTMVVLFHYGITGFEGGYVGVDVFFVISGYLITKIIVNQTNTTGFSYKSFIKKRIQRIVPALIFVIVVTYVIAILVVSPKGYDNINQSLPSALFFYSNIFFWRTVGYFGLEPELNPFLHTWSLSLEMQFYLAYPFLIYFANKKDILFKTLVVTMILSLGVSTYATANMPVANFFLLPTRSWEFISGGIASQLALGRNLRNSKIDVYGMLVGLLLLVSCSIYYDKTTSFPGVAAIPPVVATILFIISMQIGNFNLKHLSPIIYVGKISYSIYLWHFSLISISRWYWNDEINIFVIMGNLLLTLILSHLTFKYIENPLRRPNAFNEAMKFCFSLIAFLIVILIAIGVNKGFENIYDITLNDEQRLISNIIDKEAGKNLYDNMENTNKCNYWVKTLQDLPREKFWECNNLFGKATLIIGDSHAMNLYNIFAMSGGVAHLIGISSGGCRPVNNQPQCSYNSIVQFLREHGDSIEKVIYHQSGSYMLEDSSGRVDSIEIFRNNQSIKINEKSYDSVIRYLRSIKGPYALIWVGPFLEARVNLENKKSLSKDDKVNKYGAINFELLDRELEQRLAEGELFAYKSVINEFRFNNDLILQKDCIVYNDGDHFSKCGEELLSRKTILKELIGNMNKF
jgi:peptidoglycan/LPS O-acetylase OafA/YrhL